MVEFYECFGVMQRGGVLGGTLELACSIKQLTSSVPSCLGVEYSTLFTVKKISQTGGLEREWPMNKKENCSCYTEKTPCSLQCFEVSVNHECQTTISCAIHAN